MNVDTMREIREGRRYVTAMTERGVITGAVHTVIRRGGRSDTEPAALVIEHISSGSLLTVSAGAARDATPEEIDRMWRHVEWVERLHESERGIVAGLASTEVSSRADSLLAEARRRGLTTAEAGAFHKVERPGSDRCVYLAKNCRRVDLSGFTFIHPLVRSVGEAEARLCRLGRVRGQAKEVPSDGLEGLWSECLSRLMEE